MAKSSKKVLVTGVAGFLGSHLAEKLSEMKHEVVGVDNMSGGYEDNIPQNVKFYNVNYPILMIPFLSKASEILGKKILIQFNKFEYYFTIIVFVCN